MLVSRLSWSFSEMQSWSWRCKYTHASLCTYCDIFAYYIYYPYIFSENWVTKLSFPCELHSFCFSAPRDNKTRLYRFTDQNTPFLTIIHTIQYLLLSVCCLYRFKNLKKKKKRNVPIRSSLLSTTYSKEGKSWWSHGLKTAVRWKDS